MDATATTAGVLAEVDGEQMTISGLVLADGGAELARDTCTGALQEHLQLARWLAERLRRRLSAVS
ncbi:MAG TPA: hypothetical protein PKM88_15155 [bacterium]|nr:hypothetical protein [bacterium]